MIIGPPTPVSHNLNSIVMFIYSMWMDRSMGQIKTHSAIINQISLRNNGVLFVNLQIEKFQEKHATIKMRSIARR